MTAAEIELPRAVGLARQLLMVVLINIPTVSLGLAMGWVSLASGERADAEGDGGGQVVVAAATTFLASVVGVPLAARALSYGRKFAVIATSACFVVCWSLKLAGGGWWVVAARVAAGLGGAGAYTLPPLIAREMCEERVHGATSSALILAHNLGFLLMYLAADLGMQHSAVAWSCLCVSALHCALFLLVPESPAFLAATGREKEAVASLAWLRGVRAGEGGVALARELAALPAPDPSPLGPLALLKDMLSVPGRRRAFLISFVAIVGQEACGVYTLLQFAERVFVLARDAGAGVANATLTDAAMGQISSSMNATGVWSDTGAASSAFLSDDAAPLAASALVTSRALVTPARQAVILGAVQLVASAIGLYLVEKVGRRRLLVWSALATALCLAGGAAAVLAELGAVAGEGVARVVAGVALAAAVGADSAGLQPAPYALLADMFHYEHRSCALMVTSVGANIASAVEVVVFAALAARGGLAAALLLAAALAAAYALFALLAVPETKGRSPEHIYDALAPKLTKDSVAEKGQSHELCVTRM